MSKRIAFLTANEGIEAVELTKPWEALEKAGYEPQLIAPKAGTAQLFNHLDKAETKPVDLTLDKAEVAGFDALVLPGGVANPDALRMEEGAVTFVKEFVDSGKPVAAICHAPWILVEADVVDGRDLTSWPSLQTDIINAGGTWTDQELVIDGNILTSRNPDDLPAFIDGLIGALENADAPQS